MAFLWIWSTKDYKRFNYRIGTDWWFLIVLVLYYYLILLQYPFPKVDLYTLFLISLVKILWTATSNIKIFKDKIIFHHKEFPNYKREVIYFKNIEKVIFKTLVFTFGEKEFLYIKYNSPQKVRYRFLKEKDSEKEILINLDNFAHKVNLKTALQKVFALHNIKFIDYTSS